MVYRFPRPDNLSRQRLRLHRQFRGAPLQLLAQMPPERAEYLRSMGERMAKTIPLIDGDKVQLPFTVVHATRLE